jgi:fucose permease
MGIDRHGWDLWWVVLQGTFLMKFIKPQKLLFIYALINILLLVLALNTSGKIAVYTLTAVPFFMSIMFPTILPLGIKELGEETKMASVITGHGNCWRRIGACTDGRNF